MNQAIISMVVGWSWVPIPSSAVSFLSNGVLDGIGTPNQRFIIIVFTWTWLVLYTCIGAALSH
jgi:hypothetical protein